MEFLKDYEKLLYIYDFGDKWGNLDLDYIIGANIYEDDNKENINRLTENIYNELITNEVSNIYNIDSFCGNSDLYYYSGGFNWGNYNIEGSENKNSEYELKFDLNKKIYDSLYFQSILKDVCETEILNGADRYEFSKDIYENAISNNINREEILKNIYEKDVLRNSQKENILNGLLLQCFPNSEDNRFSAFTNNITYKYEYGFVKDYSHFSNALYASTNGVSLFSASQNFSFGENPSCGECFYYLLNDKQALADYGDQELSGWFNYFKESNLNYGSEKISSLEGKITDNFYLKCGNTYMLEYLNKSIFQKGIEGLNENVSKGNKLGYKPDFTSVFEGNNGALNYNDILNISQLNTDSSKEENIVNMILAAVNLKKDSYLQEGYFEESNIYNNAGNEYGMNLFGEKITNENSFGKNIYSRNISAEKGTVYGEDTNAFENPRYLKENILESIKAELWAGLNGADGVYMV